MKALLLTLALAAVATLASAQGTIQFANNAGTRFRFSNGIWPNEADGGPPGGTLYFGVFAGNSANNLSIQPVLPLGTNTSIGGMISAPSPQAYQLPGWEANSTVFLQIRCWESRFGTDWQAGQAGLHGQTTVRSFLLGPASGPGTVIWSSTDLNKFQAIAWLSPWPGIPEPSVLALAGFGLGSLLLFRCRT